MSAWLRLFKGATGRAADNELVKDGVGLAKIGHYCLNLERKNTTGRGGMSCSAVLESDRF